MNKEEEVGIEDATKPTFETIATTIGMHPEESSIEKEEIIITKEKESAITEVSHCPKCGEPLRYLENVRIEAGISKTINLGNMEFIKANAGISGDIGRRKRSEGWKEAWSEVEIQLLEELVKQLVASKMKRDRI